MVYSRGQGGAIVYALPDWDQPNTQDQLAARDAITNLSAAWSATLTEAQRNSWRKYAHQHPLPDRWGQPRLVNGYCYFVRVNARWYRDASAIQWASAPDVAPLHLPLHSVTALAAGDAVTLALPPLNYNPAPPGLILWHQAGKPVAGGVNYFNGPWRYTEKNTNAPPWSSTPWIITWPWPFDAGQRIFSRLVAQDLTSGALSSPATTSATAS